MGTVIFDLDGTLADTSGDMIAAANTCFREMGAGDLLDPVEDGATAMRGGRAMLALGLARIGRSDDVDSIDLWHPRLLQAYGGALDRYSRLFPGVGEAMAQLHAAGYRTGICTNKPEQLAHRLLVSLGVRDLFASLIGADTLAVRKPDAGAYRAAVTRAGGDVARSILIGDTGTDRDTARAAGVPCVLVTFGPSGQETAALAPEALLHSYGDLAGVVHGLLGVGMARG